MKVKANDLGICGVEQLFYAGSVNFDTEDADKGVVLCKAPEKVIITRGVAVVSTAFNAGTTNPVSVGTNSDVNNILASSDITAGTAGTYSADKFVEVAKGAEIKIKYAPTGTDATAGAADIYLFAVGIPD